MSIHRFSGAAFLPGLFTGILITGFLAFTFRAETPACAISLDRMNVLYCGFDNPASILVRGVPEEQVQVQCSENLSIQKTGGFQYIIRASTPGPANITVSGGQLSPVTFRYRVKRIPDPLLLLGAQYSSCTLGSGAFKAQGGLAAVISGFFDIDARCDMISYEVAHLRNGQLLTEATNIGARFTDAVKPVIEDARPGDTYIFQNAKTRCPGDKAARLLPDAITIVIR